MGSGGFAHVWKGKDLATGKLYALKIIQGIDPDSSLADRFRQEAEVSIPSGYIVPVAGFREWDAQTYLILFDYFPGCPLNEYLAKAKPDDAQKRYIFQQILLGVADAHRCNIIHRDLKPDNILVGEGGEVRIIDFGIAKLKDRKLTKGPEIMGTYPWMAPEILIKGAITADARVDIYALGHIFYELATGAHFWARRPWGLGGFEEFIETYIKQDPPPETGIDLSDFFGGFHPNAAAVIAKMVRLDPEERYASIEDILSDLGYTKTEIDLPADFHQCYPMLIVESGNNKGARSLLNLPDGGRRAIGRIDIAGNDDSISRQHLEFTRTGNDYFVRDLGSKNGTLLRGIVLDPTHPPTPIQHSDRIKVGDVFLRFAFIPVKP